MPSHDLKVIEVKTETPTIRSVRLGLGADEFSFKPGQYCLVSLEVGEKKEDHAFSIAASPTRSGPLLFSTRRSDSPYKKSFFSLQPGDSVTVMGPMGRFVYDEASSYTVFLSGGIGITPIKSMMEYVADRGLDHRLILLFGNRSPDEIPFRRELDELAMKHSNLDVVHVVSRPDGGGEPWSGPVGRIDEILIRRHVPEFDRARYMICGPPGMVSGLRRLLEGMKVSGNQVKIENFAGYE